MARWASVLAGFVYEFWVPPTEHPDLTPADCFPPGRAAGQAGSFVPCDATVQPGWTYDGKIFAAPPPSPPPGLADLRAYAAAARYAKETGGITVTTALIATDRDSQAMITGMVAGLALDPNLTASFKTNSGVFVTINADQIRKIGSAVLVHVQTCFSTEAQVIAGIGTGTIKTFADVDAAFAALAA